VTTIDPLNRALVRKALNENGFHAEREDQGDWLVSEATFVHGAALVLMQMPGAYLAASSLPNVAAALAAEGLTPATTASPAGIPAFQAASLSELARLLRRIHQLMASLPDTPWAQFVARTRALPANTEAERVVVQRVGQDIFRQSLLDYWNGACAVTGLDQPEMLRASHIKSWSACENSPEERLDVFNGLLLSADIDTAFDCGLITFNDEGEVQLGSRLSATASARLSSMRIQNSSLMTDKHRAYLKWHRLNRFDRFNPSE
jgi:hypothetical protein